MSLNSTDRRRGFTLVEALVAMAIAAMGFAGLYQLLSGAARLERGAAQVQTMTVIAEEVLLRTSVAPPGMAAQGAEGEYQWSLGAVADPQLTTLSLVTVEVVAPDGARIQIRSARPAQEPEPAAPEETAR